MEFCEHDESTVAPAAGVDFSPVVANFGLFASARPQFPSYDFSSSPSLSCVSLAFSGLTIGSCLRDGVIWYQVSIAPGLPADFPKSLETVCKFGSMVHWQLLELVGGAPLALHPWEGRPGVRRRTSHRDTAIKEEAPAQLPGSSGGPTPLLLC